MTVIPMNRMKKLEDKRPKKDKEEAKYTDIESLYAEFGVKPFKQEYKRLTKSVGDDDFSSSRSAYALLRAQLSMCINSLPIIEEAVYKYKNDRAAYALVAVSNHIRELAHDLRAFGDQSELAERVRRDVMQSVMSSLATAIVADLIKTRQKLYAALQPKAAALVQKELTKCQERLTEIFTEADTTSAELISKVLISK